MRTLPIRPLRRAAGLIVFALLVSGCFQTAGAALDATATPNGGAIVNAVTIVPTTIAAPPTAITPGAVVAVPTDQTSLTPGTATTDPNLITPTVAQLVFTTATPTPAPTDTTLTVAALNFVTSTDVPTATGTPSATIGSAFLTFTPVVSATPVLSATPGPSATPVVLIVTATPIPVTNTPVVIVITATPSPITPTLTPSITLTPTPTATEPRIITPTKAVAVAQAATNPSTFNSDQATQTQQANAALATAIIQTSTASAGQQLTQVATLQGTGIPAGGQAATPEPPTAAPGGVQVTFTPTPLPVINTAAVTGATGPITSDCIYTVQAGDHLFRIAMRFNLTTYQVAYANNLINPDLLRLNQTLRIPACNVPPVAQEPAPSTTPTTSPIVSPIPVGGSAASGGAGGKTYMVVDGDTLYSIANRFGVRVIALAQANGISNISLIYIGQMLVIPG